MAPGTPAIFSPTNVAELTAIGPGVIWDMVIKSVNSAIDSHPCAVRGAEGTNALVGGITGKL